MRWPFYVTILVNVTILGLIGSGCSSPVRPDLAIHDQDQPFYSAGDETIYLETDPARLTVESDRPAAAVEVLSRIGVDVDSIGHPSVPLNRELWVVYLHPGTTVPAAIEAANTLRRTAGFRFVSNAYIYPGGEFRLMVPNEFVVRLEPTASERELVSLNERIGAIILKRDPAGSTRYILALTACSDHTPLEIYAFYNQQPFIDYADPNFISNIRPWSSGE